MSTIGFHPEARAELRHAVLFYKEQGPGLASEFVAEVRHVLRQIVDFPYSGSPDEADEDIRRAFLRRFPFTLIYRLGPNEITVVAVMHQHRWPGYWRERK